MKNKKADPKKFMKYIKTKCVDSEKYYLLLDEVQLMDSFESVLNGYIRKRNLDIYVTGDMISPHYDEDGILLVNIYDFLLNPTVLEE